MRMLAQRGRPCVCGRNDSRASRYGDAVWRLLLYASEGSGVGVTDANCEVRVGTPTLALSKACSECAVVLALASRQ